MAAVTVRNLPESTHRALRARARQNGRSTEAELRDIIETAVKPPERIKLGTLLHEAGLRYGGVELNIDREPPTPPIDFGW